MIRELFLEDISLWGCVWQSTLFAVIGLAGSFLLRRRPARASQVLFLAMIAAVLVPTMSILVKHFELGMFEAEPITLEPEVVVDALAIDYESSMSVSRPEVSMGAGELASAKTSSGSTKVSWRMIVLYGWMIATLILLGRLLVAFVSGVLLLRRAQFRGCEQIQQAADSARTRLGITKDLQVRSSKDIRSPVIWCWSPTPVLLVPGDLDYAVDWESVIYHELAHWRRRDHISGLIAELVVCILPWNPILWCSKKRMVRLSEQACDDWVVAGGQPCEDYAQSLLDFKPQKQVAFVPAVVSSKKTLAGRVRRILEQKCASPHSGLRWSLAAALVTGFIAVGVAFAQTRSTRPTRTIKTKVGRSAVIERPAASSFMMIKGRILDPNNETAYRARIVALPATSYGAEIRLNNKEGYFELPWSPTWLEEGQAVCLIARGPRDRNEAAFVEVYDPTSPVIVRLEPAVTLTGKVIDPNGQPIRSTVILSLARPFRCLTPILDDTSAPATHIDKLKRGKFTIDRIPYNQTYMLNIEAEGYQTKHLTLDSTDRSKEIIDIGTITLKPQDPTKPAVAEQAPNPDLAKEFHDIYCLEENEVIKFIKPPFLLGRQDYFNHLIHNDLGLESGGRFHFVFDWDGELHPRYGTTSHYQRLERILQRVLHIPIYDFNLPEKLNLRLDASDWIVRRGLPLEKQLRALEEILYAELNRSICFEKRTAEREVIVAKGRFEFKPLRSEDPNWLYLFLDENDRLGGPVVSLQPDSVSELLLRIANTRGVDIAIEDKTEPCEIPKIRCRCSTSLIIDMSKARERNLPILFDNLAKQTGLQFKVERQPAEIWFVTETKVN